MTYWPPTRPHASTPEISKAGFSVREPDAARGQAVVGRIGQFLRSAALPCTLAATAILAFRRLDDSDTWWHLAAGRWIAENGRVPTTDPFSYTVPDHAWLDLQWLYDLALYGLWQTGGANALVVAAVVTYTLAIALLVGTLRRWVGVSAACALALWAVVVAEERFLIRPEMISFVLLGLVLRTLLTVSDANVRRLLVVPLVVLVWVNTHSLFVIGLFCIACTALGAAGAQALDAMGRKRASAEIDALPLLACAAAATAVAFINPYFVRGVTFPLELLTRIDGSNSVYQAIGEFRPPWSGYFETLPITAYQGLAVVSVVVVLVAAIVRLVAGPRARLRFRPGAVALFFALLYVSTLARRNIALFALGALPTVAMAIAIIDDVAPAKARALLRKLETPFAASVVAFALLLCGWVANNGYYRWNGSTHAFGLGTFEANFPIAASDFAREAELAPKLYNDLSAGGYLTWSRPVEDGVFIDGRLEVYDTEFFASYRRGLENAAEWDAAATRYDFRSVILFHRWPNRHGLIRRLATSSRWRLVHKDEVAVVFARTGTAADLVQLTRQYERDTAARLARRRAWSWQYPIERAIALRSYADLLLVLGEIDAALATYDELLSIGLRPIEEAEVRYRYGFYLARRGEIHRARSMLERALELVPGDPRIRQVLDAIAREG
jgi:hypothetical protein